MSRLENFSPNCLDESFSTRLCVIFGQGLARGANSSVMNFAGRGGLPLPRNSYSWRKLLSKDAFKHYTKSSSTKKRKNI